MNQQEFETAVRELRQLQRRFFHTKKDDPDRQQILEPMRQKEKEVFTVCENVMAIRPNDQTPRSDREVFFLAVVKMMRYQHEWKKQGGGNNHLMFMAKEAEKVVDQQLCNWDELKKKQEAAKREEMLKNQTSLF